MRKKGKTAMTLLIVFGSILLVLGGALLFTNGEREEGRNLPIATLDFDRLRDGRYNGRYEGGKYKRRANEVQVTVTGGKLTNIKQLSDKERLSADMIRKMDDMYGRIVKAQSLQVDTISMATITSKAHLKAVEIALDKAMN